MAIVECLCGLDATVPHATPAGSPVRKAFHCGSWRCLTVRNYVFANAERGTGAVPMTVTNRTRRVIRKLRARTERLHPEIMLAEISSRCRMQARVGMPCSSADIDKLLELAWLGAGQKEAHV
jgi:hypothetical protein